ncbi:Signal recognition particle 54 kDa chloroplastic isoform B [Chlorella sorokiniana]|uniref:signal-recognition-particle GTPase n=1 Tax=Chlorella sorokiniana TaxID=3076 RepID=A0A2P6TNI6_CHLSO|nr:Signal recognition particle 54 kDa chloroplastic isoform B [Chlorella sorokiniana]|eukprot:PRW50901.1 Signal recognition particle 54 kDa chloroplastic isoform B [Chlorella sorokiniana]
MALKAPTQAAAGARAPAAAAAVLWRPAAALQRRRLPPPQLAEAAPRRARAARLTALRTRAAMFDGLSRSLEKAWDSVRRDGKLTAENVKEPMREIRRALLEADVSLPVVRRFVKKVEEAALGERVVKGLSPDQKLVKVVFEELKQLMGGQQAELVQPKYGPAVILMAGLQGTGKTTAAGKLALHLKKKGLKVLLVATDVYRPAAIDQLVTLGSRIEVPVFELGTEVKPPEIARQGLEKAKQEEYDAVIVDTAGRLQIDERLMDELRETKAAVNPTDTLLVVDAMTGQEAAGLVKAFNDAVDITGAVLTKMDGDSLDITGAVLTKMDGDSRGGAALSIKEVSGRPIKFVGTGEKMEALEPFYPERMASRILGMGDVVSLVEKAEDAIQAEEAAELTKKMMTAKFDFNDFLKQYKMVTGMGNLSSLVKMLPGMNKVNEKQLAEVERKYKTYESMIQSMTKQEREQPELLAKSPSRRRRIARGSGRTEEQVAELIGMFTSMRAQMQTLSRMMALSGGAQGVAGMPQMSDEEMMEAVMGGTGPRKVAPGKVRRKRGSRGMAELVALQQ